MGTWRGGRLCAGVQPANGNVRADIAGSKRLRELGFDVCAARRPVGTDRACDEPANRNHHARDDRQRRRRSNHTSRSRRHVRCCPDRQWRRLRRTRRQRIPASGRQLAEVRQRIVGIGKPARAARLDAERDQWRARIDALDVERGHGPATRPRSRGAQRRRDADARLRRGQKRRRSGRPVVPAEHEHAVERRRACGRRARRRWAPALRMTRHDEAPEALRKTRARLKREIAYYAGVAWRAASRDRVRLALIAIAGRERQLNALRSGPIEREEE